MTVGTLQRVMIASALLITSGVIHAHPVISNEAGNPITGEPYSLRNGVPGSIGEPSTPRPASLDTPAGTSSAGQCHASAPASTKTMSLVTDTPRQALCDVLFAPFAGVYCLFSPFGDGVTLDECVQMVLEELCCSGNSCEPSAIVAEGIADRKR
jgi:hypothetical protein